MEWEGRQNRTFNIGLGNFPDVEAETKITKDPNDDLSTEELRQRAIQQEDMDRREKLKAEREMILVKFLKRDHPEILETRGNIARITAGLQELLQRTGREFPFWQEPDLISVVDSLWDGCQLDLSGPYKRQTPTHDQLYEMPMAQLEKLMKDKVKF